MWGKKNLFLPPAVSLTMGVKRTNGFKSIIQMLSYVKHILRNYIDTVRNCSKTEIIQKYYECKNQRVILGSKNGIEKNKTGSLFS